MEAPTPQPAATLAVPRLVNSHRRLLRQSLLQLLVAGRHRRTGFLHRLEHLAVADWQLKHIGQKSANRLDRHVTSALLISHQRRQPRTKQPRPPHFLRQRRGQHLARAKVLIQSGAMLAHDIGFLNQLDLLDDAKAVERFPTCRHGLPLVVPSLVHLLRRKSWSGMTGVSQLTASPSLPAFSAACRRTRRLDDVAAGRLGGGCGVLLQTLRFRSPNPRFVPALCPTVPATGRPRPPAVYSQDNVLCVSPCLNSIRTISEITYTNLPSL